MREPIRDKERLMHIKGFIERIQKYTIGLSFEKMQENELIYYGIVKNIEMIGEAVYMLSKEFKESHADLPWKNIEGMRHVLVHDHYQIQPIRVWEVVVTDLEPLRIKIDSYLDECVKQQ